MQIDVTNVALETDRLLLRGWSDADLEDFYTYASVPGVGEMAGWKHHASRAQTAAVLRMFQSEKNVFAVVEKQSGRVIGSVGLHRSWADFVPELQRLHCKEIGYVLSKTYWGQGLIPEAVRRVIAYCFDVCGLDAVTVSHFKENDQSRRVIEKCGFRFYKTGSYFAKDLQQTFETKEYILYRRPD